MDADYGRFLVLRRQQVANAKAKQKVPVPLLAEDVHDEFMGSRPQLLFGKVLGDVFGIHPVFAALLSSTGGMVGPGNKALQMDDDDPTGYHGIVHDAAGYLYNYHGEGPGYDYLGVEGRPTDDPLSGQQSGMRYWHEKLEPGLTTVLLVNAIDALYAGSDTHKELQELRAQADVELAEFRVAAEKKLDDARSEVAQAIEEALAKGERELDEATDKLNRAAQDARSAVDDAMDALEQSAVEKYGELFGATNPETSRKLEAAREYAME